MPKMYLMLFNFIVDGENRKGIHFMVHLWTVLIILAFFVYLRALILHFVCVELIAANNGAIVFGLFLPIISVFFIKYVVIILLGRGTLEKPVNSDEEPVKYKYVNKKHK